MRIFDAVTHRFVGGGWLCGDGLWRLTAEMWSGGAKLEARTNGQRRFTGKDPVKTRRELMIYDMEHMKWEWENS